MIPNYQALLLPCLEVLASGKTLTLAELNQQLAEKLKLTPQECAVRLESGAVLFYSRVSWARTYLKKAGLIEFPQKGVSVITELGKATLSKNLDAIDNEYLKQFPSFVSFIKGEHRKEQAEENNVAFDEQTPEEKLEYIYQGLQSALATDLLDKLLSCSPAFFEKLVVELLVKMGYGGSLQDAGKAIGKSGDEGIDGIIKEDKLGLDMIYVQAKRWNRNNFIGRPELQKFVGALAGQGAKKGFFITTSSFTQEAWQYAPKTETKIVLIDGILLTQLMIEYNLGCTTQKNYEIKRLDSDYFEEL
jgi:restriction system protein